MLLILAISFSSCVATSERIQSGISTLKVVIHENRE